VTADFTPKPGQNIFRDVTTDPITGKPHKVKVCGPWLQFDEDEPIQLPEPGMHARLWCSGDKREALVRGHDTDHVYLVNDEGAVVDMDKVMGDYAAAFGPDGTIHAQRDNLGPGYSAEGIHHIKPDGRWVMNNAVELNSVVGYQRKDDHGIDLIQLIQGDMRGNYRAAKCDRLTNSGIARLGPDGLHHYGQYSQFAPFVNEQGWVAIQGSEWKMTPEPDAVPWIRHEDLPAKPPTGDTPPPPIVTPPPAPDRYQEGFAAGELVGLQFQAATITRLRAEIATLGESVTTLGARVADLVAQRNAAMTPTEVLRLVNDATGQMAGYWRYLGVQGAVDRAVKAELAKRK
jgi:hypothetical protein